MASISNPPAARNCPITQAATFSLKRPSRVVPVTTAIRTPDSFALVLPFESFRWNDQPDDPQDHRNNETATDAPEHPRNDRANRLRETPHRMTSNSTGPCEPHIDHGDIRGQEVGGADREDAGY